MPKTAARSAVLFDRTQRAWVLLLPLPVILFLMGGLLVRLVREIGLSRTPALVTWIGIALLLAVACSTAWVAVTFATLSVRLDSENIQWQFGAGAMRRSIPIRSISSVNVVRNDWTAGLGYHLYEPRSVYSVWGLDAVEITFGKGERVRIGTDKPSELYEALMQARSPVSHAIVPD